MKTIVSKLLIGGAAALALLATPATSFAATPTPVVATRPSPEEIGEKTTLLALSKATADLTGIAPYTIAKELRDGKSLTEIAASKGKTADEVIAQARTTLSTWTTRAVARGAMTQQRADALLARFDKFAPAAMARTDVGTEARTTAARAALIQATAEVTGLTPRGVLGELRAGKSIAQIAEAAGKTTDDVLRKLAELQQDRNAAVNDAARQLVDQPGAGLP
jgi:uncharacterized protein (DUF433 family)